MTDAEAFVERFAQVWRAPKPLEYASLWHPEGTLLHPGMDHAIPSSDIPDYIVRLLRLAPNIHLIPDNWASRDNIVFIEWTLHVSANERGPRWRGADRFTLRGDRALEGIAYFDTFPISMSLDPTLRRPEVDHLGLPVDVEASR